MVTLLPWLSPALELVLTVTGTLTNPVLGLYVIVPILAESIAFHPSPVTL